MFSKFNRCCCVEPPPPLLGGSVESAAWQVGPFIPEYLSSDSISASHIEFYNAPFFTAGGVSNGVFQVGALFVFNVLEKREYSSIRITFVGGPLTFWPPPAEHLQDYSIYAALFANPILKANLTDPITWIQSGVSWGEGVRQETPELSSIVNQITTSDEYDPTSRTRNQIAVYIVPTNTASENARFSGREIPVEFIPPPAGFVDPAYLVVEGTRYRLTPAVAQ